jgi:uncharacterized protein (TIGR03435 family)
MKRLPFFVVTGFAVLLAQSQTPSFEVATIKPHDPSSAGVASGISFGQGRFSGAGSLRSLIQFAHGVQDYQVSGGLSWTNTELYDVIGKPASPAPPDQLRIMLQSLLAERFKLSFHRETTDVPVYALIVVKSGPKLQEVRDPTLIGRMSGGKGMLRGEMKLADLARYLSPSAGRPVIDRTGLMGAYEINLQWSPDNSTDADKPSLFTAVQEQLGLKLDSAKGPVEVLVIDHVEKPSGN